MSPLLLVLAGLTGLFVGGDLLVRGAAGIATRLAVPPMIVGLTIVGFGTSVPELLVSLDAALSGVPAIAIGNVLGSNIANILLILGLAALLAPLPAPLAGVRKDLGWMLAAALALPMILWSGSIGLIEGGLLITGLAAYLWVSLRGAAGEAPVDAPALPLSVIFFAAGLAGIIFGAGFLVDGATALARGWGLSEAIIGLTIVAVGTSLPELAATIAAALKSQRDIALGNIIGSNIFNILGILGITAVVTPIPVEPRFRMIDTPVVLAITLALAALIAWRGVITRLAGLAMLAAYAAYLALTAT